jgi:hypothetical protein
MLPRLLFTVTTGRSGTDYLARLLGCVPGVASHHEPRPHFVWAMRAAQSDPTIAETFWRELKLPAIAQCQRPVYAETSHLVCKGFIEPLLAAGIVPDLILLRRDHREVATSLYRLGTIPGRTSKGLKWYLSPADAGVLALNGWQELHDYQLCYWYCLEIERRRQLYAERLRPLGGRIADISLAELTTLRGFMRMRRDLELPGYAVGPQHWFRYLHRAHVRVNLQASQKRSAALPSDADALEREVERRVAAGSLTATITNATTVASPPAP